MFRRAPWLRSLRPAPSCARPVRPLRFCRPWLEPLEDRIAPATLDIDGGGNLTYSAANNVTNSLTVSTDPTNYTFSDTGETIDLLAGAIAAGWTGDNTNIVTGTTASVSAITINLGNNSDSLTLGNFAGDSDPLTANGQDGFLDQATVAAGGAGLTAAGNVAFNGFEDVLLNNQVTATSANLSFNDDPLVTLGANVTLTARDLTLTGNVRTGQDPNNFNLTVNVSSFAPVSTISAALQEDGDFIMNGIGELVLTGSNTLTGATTINAGRLQVNGSLLDSDILVNAGAALGGIGQLGDVTVSPGGVVTPGTSPGSIFGLSFLFQSFSELQVQINGKTPGTQHDQITSDGPVNLSDAELFIDSTGYTPQAGDVITLIEAGSRLGFFSGLPEGSPVTIGGQTGTIRYTPTGVEIVFAGNPNPTPNSNTSNVAVIPSQPVAPPVNSGPLGLLGPQLFRLALVNQLVGQPLSPQQLVQVFVVSQFLQQLPQNLLVLQQVEDLTGPLTPEQLTPEAAAAKAQFNKQLFAALLEALFLKGLNLKVVEARQDGLGFKQLERNQIGNFDEDLARQVLAAFLEARPAIAQGELRIVADAVADIVRELLLRGAF